MGFCSGHPPVYLDCPLQMQIFWRKSTKFGSFCNDFIITWFYSVQTASLPFHTVCVCAWKLFVFLCGVVSFREHLLLRGFELKKTHSSVVRMGRRIICFTKKWCSELALKPYCFGDGFEMKKNVEKKMRIFYSCPHEANCVLYVVWLRRLEPLASASVHRNSTNSNPNQQ